MRIVWSRQAVYSWQRIADYIKETFGIKTMLTFRAETSLAQKQLLFHPLIGSFETRNDSGIEFRYMLINKRSKLIYHIDMEYIYIDTFWDTRMDPQDLIGQLNEIN